MHYNMDESQKHAKPKHRHRRVHSAVPLIPKLQQAVLIHRVVSQSRVFLELGWGPEENSEGNEIILYLICGGGYKGA